MGDGGVEHQAVAVHDGGRHPVVDGTRRGLPGEPSSVTIEFQSIGEVLGLLAGADEQYNSKELLVAFILLLLFQDQHEVVAKTRLHHHPVHGAWQVDVCRQEDDVLPLQRKKRYYSLYIPDLFQRNPQLSFSVRLSWLGATVWTPHVCLQSIWEKYLHEYHDFNPSPRPAHNQTFGFYNNNSFMWWAVILA